ncbi:MAG: AraC family transcriptional regulator [Firmicutes bacterium]|jgi:DNA-directed RNA polymerase subunit delta|nr:AraC family transcriptional regulator [Bacillota bacterium]
MEDLSSRMGYLKGLVDGLGVDGDKKEGKIIYQIIAVLDEVVDSIRDLEEDCDELYSYVETMDEDLTALEDDCYEDDDYDYDDLDDDYDYDDDDFDDFDDDDDDDYEHEFADGDEYEVSFTVECPECRYEVPIDDDILENEDTLEVLCPNCGKVVFINDEEWEEGLEEMVDEGGEDVTPEK